MQRKFHLKIEDKKKKKIKSLLKCSYQRYIHSSKWKWKRM